MILLRLPLPPNGNHRNGYNRKSATWYPTAETKKYRRLVQLTAKGISPIDKGPISVRVLVHRGLDKNGKLQRGDLDGYLKTLLDHLQGVAYRNDSQIRRLEAELFDAPDTPCVEVTVADYISSGHELQRDMFSPNALAVSAPSILTSEAYYPPPKSKGGK